MSAASRRGPCAVSLRGWVVSDVFRTSARAALTLKALWALYEAAMRPANALFIVTTLIAACTAAVSSMLPSGPSVATAQEPTETAVQSASPSPVETETPQTPPTAESSETPPPTVRPNPTLGAERVISNDATLAGFAAYPPGQPETNRRVLVELHLNARFNEGVVDASASTGLIALFTADDGAYSFENVPTGEHLLWVWSGAGFINVSANVSNRGVFIVPFVVRADGTVEGGIPETIELAEKPSGVLGYPIRTGFGGGPVPIGRVDVAALLGRPIRLPSTGGSGSDGGWVPYAIIVLLLAAGAAFGGSRLIRRAR